MIQLRTRIRLGPSDRLRALARKAAPAARRRLADQLIEATRSEVLRETPVRTGRLRDGWATAETKSDDADTRSRRSLTNDVPYVTYVEYGTRRTPPRFAVRRGLRRVLGTAAALFRLNGGRGAAPSWTAGPRVEGDSDGLE